MSYLTNGVSQNNWFAGVRGPSNTGRFLPGVGVQIAPDMNANLVRQWAARHGSGAGGGTGAGLSSYGTGGSQPAGVDRAATASLANLQPAGAYAGAGYGQAAPPNNMLMDLYKNFQDQYLQAKRANESRYGDILTGYQKRYADANANLGQFSDQAKQDVNRRADQELASTQQSAISRGLGNTTVVDSLQRGVNEDRNAELRRVNDADLQRRLQYQTGMSKEQLDFMERRQDSYPDLTLMANMAMEAGRGGNGGAGAGAYGPTGGGLSPGASSVGTPGAGTYPAPGAPAAAGYGAASQPGTFGTPENPEWGWAQRPLPGGVMSYSPVRRNANSGAYNPPAGAPRTPPVPFAVTRYGGTQPILDNLWR